MPPCNWRVLAQYLPFSHTILHDWYMQPRRWDLCELLDRKLRLRDQSLLCWKKYLLGHRKIQPRWVEGTKHDQHPQELHRISSASVANYCGHGSPKPSACQSMQRSDEYTPEPRFHRIWDRLTWLHPPNGNRCDRLPKLIPPATPRSPRINPQSRLVETVPCLPPELNKQCVKLSISTLSGYSAIRGSLFFRLTSPQKNPSRRPGSRPGRRGESVLPDGQIKLEIHPASRACPVPAEKIFWFSEIANQSISMSIPSHLRGGSRSSRTRDGMRWTRMVLLTRALEADGEVVWS